MDAVIPHPIGLRNARHLATRRVVTLETVGHYLHMEAPAEVAAHRDPRREARPERDYLTR